MDRINTPRGGKMKRTIVFTAAIFCLAMVAGAQPQGQQQGQRGGTPEERVKRQTEWMKTELKLTDVQMAKVDSVYLAAEKEMAALREKVTDRQARREAQRPIMEKRLAALKTLLTDEQLKKVQERAQQGRRQGGGGGGQP